jgi:hypothetical protein
MSTNRVLYGDTLLMHSILHTTCGTAITLKSIIQVHMHIKVVNLPLKHVTAMTKSKRVQTPVVGRTAAVAGQRHPLEQQSGHCRTEQLGQSESAKSHMRTY